MSYVDIWMKDLSNKGSKWENLGVLGEELAGFRG